ncbi:MAG TPA: response regulator [Woeseiaceae bacterium]|nr:response regulator [Woeseiaceae bacterium]
MPAERSSVLIVDDDVPFAETLARAMRRRGYEPRLAHSAKAALAAAAADAPDAAIVDLRIDDDNGLDLVAPLRRLRPAMRVVILTGYASIATAVHAIKLGADNYLPKPVTAGALIGALEDRESRPAGTRLAEPMSPRRLEWEHIQRVLAENGGNVSATARALKMHRRTLQRKLAKRPQRG